MNRKLSENAKYWGFKIPGDILDKMKRLAHLEYIPLSEKLRGLCQAEIKRVETELDCEL